MGHEVAVKAGNLRHFVNFDAQLQDVSVKEQTTSDFRDHLTRSITEGLEAVNFLQNKSDNLSELMSTKPDSVNLHDVMIASEKAFLSLQFTKTILGKAVEAYQAIINMR